MLQNSFSLPSSRKTCKSTSACCHFGEFWKRGAIGANNGGRRSFVLHAEPLQIIQSAAFFFFSAGPPSQPPPGSLSEDSVNQPRAAGDAQKPVSAGSGSGGGRCAAHVCVSKNIKSDTSCCLSSLIWRVLGRDGAIALTFPTRFFIPSSFFFSPA